MRLTWKPVITSYKGNDSKCQAKPNCPNSAAQVINGQSVCIACAVTGMLALLWHKRGGRRLRIMQSVGKRDDTVGRDTKTAA